MLPRDPLIFRGDPSTTDDLLSQREQTHGSFQHNADTWGELVRLYYGAMETAGTLAEFSTKQQLALSLIFLKLARLSQRPGDIDSWRDIAGYATLIVKDLTK